MFGIWRNEIKKWNFKKRLTDIVWRVARSLQLICNDCFFGKTKICQLENCWAVLGGVEKVFRLQIPVSNIAVVQELDGQADVLHYLSGLCEEWRWKTFWFVWVWVFCLPFSVKLFFSWILLKSSPPSILKIILSLLLYYYWKIVVL